MLVRLTETWGQDGLTHIEQLSTAEEIPANYLVQILNELRNAGIINSRRGKQGGYALARDPHELTLLEIINAIEGELLAYNPNPPGKAGPRVARALGELAGNLREKARSISLHSMAQETGSSMYYI